MAPQPGERLVDLACGPGDPAFTLSEALGAQGLLIAMDPVLEMVEAVVQRRSGRGPAPVQARAESLPVASGACDGVSCRFGAMFVDDPAALAGELHRVLAVDGRAVLAVWGAPAANPYFTVVHQALEAAGAPPLERVPGQRTVFEWSEPGSLARQLLDVGFRSVDEQELPFEMVVEQTTPAEFLDRQAERSPPLAERLEQAGDSVVDDARLKVQQLVTPWARDGAIRFPALARVLRADR